MAAITLEGEALIAQYMAYPESVALHIDQMVFALVPDIDYLDEVDRDQGMPLSAHVKGILPITHAGKLNNNLVVYSALMDSTVGTWDFNWIGLYSSEDETIVAVAYVPQQEKRKTVGDLLGNVMTKNIAVEFNGAADLTGITINAESWQIDYTARLRSMDNIARNALQTFYGKSAYQQNAFKVKYASSKYYLTQGQAVIGGLDFVLNADHEITVSTLPSTVWLDVYQTQTMSDVENVFDVVVNNGTALTDYTSANGMQHTLVKLGVINSTSNIVDNRDLIIGSLKIDPNVTQQEAEAGAGTAARKWSVVAVWQAIRAWWNTIGTAFGKSILNSANAGEARTILNAVASDDGRLSNQRDWYAAIVTKADAEAGTETIARKWTAQRVHQAISGFLNIISTEFGRGLINLANASGLYNLLRDFIRPVGTFYQQYPESDGTFDAAKSPSAKFGGTWTLRFNTESAFFRTEGPLAAADRSSGVQGDAIRNITGSITSIPYQVTGVGAGAIVTNAGSVRTTTDSLNDNRSSGFSFDASRVVPTAAENRVKNYLIRVWERTA